MDLEKSDEESDYSSYEESSKSIKRRYMSKKEKDQMLNFSRIFPTNLIIIIGTHGEICTYSETDEVEEITIPKSIETVYKFNFAPAGIAALQFAPSITEITTASKKHDFEKALKEIGELSDPGKIDAYIRELLKSDKKEISYTEDRKVLDDFIYKLSAKLDKFYKNVVRTEFIKDNVEFNEEYSTLPEAGYLYIWEQNPPEDEKQYGYKKIIHLTEKMSNKVFTTGEKIERSSHPWASTITCLNVEGIPYFDLFQAVCWWLGREYRSENNYVTTEELLSFISDIKDKNNQTVVKRVAIIDTSCSVFEGFTQDKFQDVKQKGYGKKNRKLIKSKKIKKSRRTKKSRKTKKSRRTKKQKKSG